MRIDKEALVSMIFLFFLISLVTLGSASAHQGGKLFEMQDPNGDDHGPGPFMYPENIDFERGSFDLRGVEVFQTDNYINFELSFETLGGNPANGPNGFSLQIIEIYVDDGTGSVTAPLSDGSGGSAQVKIGDGWKWAVRATGWDKDTFGRWDNGTEFEVQADANSSENQITVKVPRDVVGSPAENDSWNFATLIGAENNGYWKKVKVTEGKSQNFIRWVVKDATAEGPNSAVDNNVEPRPLDVLVPLEAHQENVLSSFSTEPALERAEIPLVGPIPRSPYFTVSARPSSGIVQTGKSTSSTVGVKSFMGYDSEVSLEAVSVPQDVGVNFSQASGNAPFQTEMNIETEAGAEVGRKTIVVEASGPEITREIKYDIMLTSKLVKVEDPSGDDYGAGDLEYPSRPLFHDKGHILDVTEFLYYQDQNYYRFSFKINAPRLGGNVWGAPIGFSFQLMEVYVDCKLGGNTSAVYEEGPLVNIDSDHKWNFAFQATGWDRRQKALRNWISFSDSDNIITHEIGVTCDPAAERIDVAVPRDLVENHIGPLPENYDWHAVVLSGSQDGFSGNGSWRAVVPDSVAGPWVGSGADPQAYSMFVQPNVYDVVLPEGYSQEDILTSYSVEEGTLAEVPAISLAASEGGNGGNGGGEGGGGLPIISIGAAIAVIIVVIGYFYSRR